VPEEPDRGNNAACGNSVNSVKCHEFKDRHYFTQSGDVNARRNRFVGARENAKGHARGRGLSQWKSLKAGTNHRAEAHIPGRLALHCASGSDEWCVAVEAGVGG
jgi:hypothetical protein